MQLVECKEYPLAPELRRCCYYVIASAPLFILTLILVATFAQLRPVEDIAVGVALIGLLTAAAALPLRWRVRIDNQGVWRRLVRRWTLWSWNDLGSGHVRKLPLYTLLDPARPWWRRTLRLEFIGSERLQEAFAQINAYYRLPPPPDVPHSLSLRINFRKAVFSSRGITLGSGRTPREYPWSDVRFIELRRPEPKRRDFTKLVIILSDRELTLIENDSSRNWRGATAEQVSDLLLRHIPADCIEIVLGDDLPKNPYLLERHLRTLTTDARQTRIVMPGLLFPLAAIAIILCWIEDGLVASIPVVAMIVFVVVPGTLLTLRTQQKRLQRVQQLLAAAGTNPKD